MDEPVTLAHRSSHGARSVLVLDYASASTSQLRHWGRKIGEAGPWLIWPSLRSWGCLALLLAAALWLSCMPRNWQVVDVFRAIGPKMIGSTDRVVFRAADGTLRIRDVRGGAGSEIQLEPSSKVTEPQVSADGSKVIGFEPGGLLIWDSSSGRKLGQLPLEAFNYLGQGSVFDLINGELSSDGTRLSERYTSGHLAVWDITGPSAKLVAARRLDGELLSSSAGSFSADGGHLLLSDFRAIWLGNAKTLQDELRIKWEDESYLCANWSADRTRLIVGFPASRRGEWDVSVLDPAEPRVPIVRIHQKGSVQNPVTSRDGRYLVLDQRDVYEIPSGRKVLSFERTYWVRDVLGNDLLLVENSGWQFRQLFDVASGDVLATLPDATWAHVLSDQRTLVSSERDSVVVRRQVTQGPERSALFSPRLWVMLPLTLGLAWSLFRDGRRRARKTAPKIDQLLAAALILVGTLAPAFGLAQTSVEWNVGLREWWGAHWSDNLSLVCLFCGMGLLAGGRAWLWITRAFLVLAIVVALMNLLTTRNEVQLLVAMDRMWVASPWVVRAWCAGVVVLGAIAVLCIGRETTTAPQQLRPLSELSC